MVQAYPEPPRNKIIPRITEPNSDWGPWTKTLIFRSQEKEEERRMIVVLMKLKKIWKNSKSMGCTQLNTENRAIWYYS